MKRCSILLLTWYFLLGPRLLLASDGAVDAGFDPGTGPNFSGAINTVVAQPNGKVIVAGAFTSFNGVAHVGLVRLNENGSVDMGFNHGSGFDAAGTVALVLDAAVQGDGKILVAGGFASYDGVPVGGVVRLNTDGTVDSSFAQTNIFISVANALLPLADGKILLGLYSSPGLVRLNANGSLDTNFFLQPFRASLNDAVNTIRLQPDGKILVSGKFTKFYTDISDSVGTTRTRIARLNANGTLDTSFDAGAAPIGGSGSISGFALQSSGKIIVGGEFTNFNGTACGGVVRLNPSGAVDGTFTSDPGTTRILNLGPGVNFRFVSPVSDVSVDINDRVLLAGSFSQYNLVGCSNVVRLTANGALDPTFVNNGPNTWAQNLFLQPDGKIIISGFFTNVGGLTRLGLARLTGAPVAPVAPHVTVDPIGATVTNLSDRVGPTVAFTVAATGTEPITYAWLFNGIPIAANTGVGLAAVLAAAPTTVTMTNAYGVNTATLTISNVTMANAGKYSVRVSNTAGQDTSAQATLTVNGFAGGPTDLVKPVLTVLAPSSKVMTIGSNDVNFGGTPETRR
jgi:uncharacterized delta-60 repeat protein